MEQVPATAIHRSRVFGLGADLIGAAARCHGCAAFGERSAEHVAHITVDAVGRQSVESE